MITEHDLNEAIAECQGRKNPNTTTCVQLAAFYTIKDHMYPKEIEQQSQSYSYASKPQTMSFDYSSDTEFGQMVNKLDSNYLIGIIDELMSAVQVLNPSLYKSVLKRLQ